MLERVLPAFCMYGSVFYTLLCLLLGKPIGEASPVQFDFFELYNHFKSAPPGADADSSSLSVHCSEAVYLILTMIKRSYEESQLQTAGELTLSGEVSPLNTSAENNNNSNSSNSNNGNSSNGGPTPFVTVLAQAHHPTLKEPPGVASPTSVLSIVGSLLNVAKNDDQTTTNNIAVTASSSNSSTTLDTSPTQKKKTGSNLSILQPRAVYR